MFNFKKFIFSKFWSKNAPANLKMASEKLDSPNIHKYNEVYSGQAFTLDSFDEYLALCTMTSQRASVKLFDYILIQSASESKMYRILEIDYYGDSFPDLWIAKLALVTTFNLSKGL